MYATSVRYGWMNSMYSVYNSQCRCMGRRDNIKCYLKLSSKSGHIPRLCSPAEPSNGNPDVCSSYLSIPTCGQLIQCIVDENILSLKRGREKHCLFRNLKDPFSSAITLILCSAESFSSPDGLEEKQILCIIT